MSNKYAGWQIADHVKLFDLDGHPTKDKRGCISYLLEYFHPPHEWMYTKDFRQRIRNSLSCKIAESTQFSNIKFVTISLPGYPRWVGETRQEYGICRKENMLSHDKDTQHRVFKNLTQETATLVFSQKVKVILREPEVKVAETGLLEVQDNRHVEAVEPAGSG